MVENPTLNFDGIKKTPAKIQENFDGILQPVAIFC